MMTRRDFIKGMGALALIPFIPEMVKPEREIGQAIRYMRLRVETCVYGDPATVTIQKSVDGIKWDNTGTMIVPIDGTRWKVDYEVIDGDTEIINIEEE